MAADGDVIVPDHVSQALLDEAQYAVHEAEGRALRARYDDTCDERIYESLRFRADALRAIYDAAVKRLGSGS